MAVPEAVLRARARGAYERGRLRAALPITAASVPLVALALLATGRLAATLAGGALLAALLLAALWRGQDFARGARTGLLAGLGPYVLPLATRCTAHLCVDGVCLLYPAVCISGGVLAGMAVVFLARRTAPGARSAAYVAAALAVAGLAGSLGCVMAGAVGVFGMAAGLAVGATPLLWRPSPPAADPGGWNRKARSRIVRRVSRIRVSSASLLLLGLTALALLVRVANLDDVFTPKGVVFVEFDPYYHMWRVFQTLGHYPWVPLSDPSMNTPHGATVIWPPLFELLLATLCAALGLGPQDAEAVEKVTSFVIPVLGALTVVALYGLAQRIFGRTHALLACAILATLPAHVWYSRLGFVDHHVAVTLVQVLLFHSLLRALAAGSEPDAPFRAAMPWTAAAAACLTVGFLVWNGFLFFAFLLDLCLLALLLLERNDPRSSVWRFALITHVAAAIVITPFVIATVRVSGRAFSPLTLSWLPVAALLAFGLLGGLDGLRRSALLASWPPWLRWTLLATPVAGIAAILVHQSRNLTLGFQWLTASDRFMASVAESGSSLFTSGVFNLEQPQIWLTRFYLAAPVPLALLGLDLHRRGWRDRDRTVILIWGTALFAMSIVQRRFGEPFAPVLALLAADLLMRVHGWVARLLRPEDTPESRTPRDEEKKAGKGAPADAWSEGASQAAAWVAVAATVVLAYLPSAPGFFLALRKDGDYSRQTFEDLKRFAAVLEGRAGPVARGVPRTQGMLGPWDMGHRILYITGSPVVANNFGLHIGEDSFREPASFFLETDEARAVAALDRRKVSFVLTDWELSFAQQLVEHLGADPKPFFTPLPGPEAGTMMTPAFTQTLYFRMGSSYAGSQGLANYPGGQAVPIAALERFRLVQETSVAQPLRRLRIYERVQGARLQVTGAPGTVLRLRYAFRTPQGKEFAYRREVPLAGGAAEIRLPYSSERPEYGHTARYMIRAENATEAGLLVTEANVVQGQVIALAWMPPGAAAGTPAAAAAGPQGSMARRAAPQSEQLAKPSR